MSRVRGIPALSKKTEIVKIEDVKREFTQGQGEVVEIWKRLWSNVEMLLKTSEFKVITISDKDALKDMIPFD